MHSSFKIILAGASMVAVCAVVWRLSSHSRDALPRVVVTSAGKGREATPSAEVMPEVALDPAAAPGPDTAITDEDRLNLADPKRPGSDPSLRHRKIEKSLEAFKRADATQRYRTGGEVLAESIAVILDSEGRWKPADSSSIDGKHEPVLEPAEGESILTVDGRTYTISLAEFPEFDECTAPERVRLQGGRPQSPPPMTQALAASVQARVQQALAVLEHFQQNR